MNGADARERMAASTDALRRFVGETLNRDPAIAGTETNLIFEHTRAGPRA